MIARIESRSAVRAAEHGRINGAQFSGILATPENVVQWIRSFSIKRLLQKPRKKQGIRRYRKLAQIVGAIKVARFRAVRFVNASMLENHQEQYRHRQTMVGSDGFLFYNWCPVWPPSRTWKKIWRDSLPGWRQKTLFQIQNWRARHLWRSCNKRVSQIQGYTRPDTEPGKPNRDLIPWRYPGGRNWVKQYQNRIRLLQPAQFIILTQYQKNSNL